MARSKFYLDFGNADIKWYDGAGYGYFRHSIAPLTTREWRQIVGRSKLPAVGYIKVNGQAYAIGESARRHTPAPLPRGASRYTREYYGAGLAMAMTNAFTRSSKSLTLYATHAPQDYDYAIDLENSALGEWEVESHRGVQRFTVRDVETLDEPLGGFYHYVLNKRGRLNKSVDIGHDMVLVIDVGGHTVDAVAIDPDYDIDLTSIQSLRFGALALKEQFVNELRSNNRTRFKDSGDLDPRRVDEAILKGVYQFGNRPVPCHREAQEAINMLANDVAGVIRNLGGEANYDICLLTGGGSALIYEALTRIVPNIDFVMVETEREEMRYSNIFGTAKVFMLAERA